MCVDKCVYTYEDMYVYTYVDLCVDLCVYTHGDLCRYDGFFLSVPGRKVFTGQARFRGGLGGGVEGGAYHSQV